MLYELGENYVIKVDGLMGGKGVRVSGEHIKNHDEAISWCRELIDSDMSFLIEEKLFGPEFSLMSFSDGNKLVHMPFVQDHKRAFEGNKGPNTGGMGSYSDSNHSLPFLNNEDKAKAQQINELTAKALKQKFNQGYKGILYGGFMKTKSGVKLIEYNARFGDPEVMNILSILSTDLYKIFNDIILGTLESKNIVFNKQATVCKYAVPEGYPENPIKNEPVDLSRVNSDLLCYGAVDLRDGKLVATGSRTAAVTAVAPTIFEAEKIAESEIIKMNGRLFHRPDIGTKSLIDNITKNNIDNNN
jgi:fusion protein PurCD